MTNFEKVIEYYNNLCYSINRKRVYNGNFKEVFYMMDVTMKKNFYYECSDMYNKKENKKETKKINLKLYNMLSNIYYSFKLKMLAKKMDLKEYFENNEDICGGKTVIKNTRISPETITYSVLKNIDTSSNQVDTDSFEDAIKKTIKDYPAINRETIMLSLLYSVIYNSK